MGATFELFAACLPGLEPTVAGELQALGLSPTNLRGGVAFRGGVVDAMRAAYWLGAASHVLVRLAEFRCRALGELERKAAELPWRDWLLPRTPRTVHATTRGSRIYHTGAAEERVGNAIERVLGAASPAGAGDDDAKANVHVRFRDDVCTLSIDATDTPLHRRGWRLETGKAPLREDLAHALVLAAGWRADEPLVDPFCGSGTIAIEAAGLARGLPPGRLRPPPFAHLALFDEASWAAVPKTATPSGRTVFASDRDAGAMAATERNATRAGVREVLTLENAAIGATTTLRRDVQAEHGCVVTNPPFGRRVGAGKDLLPLYQTLGARVAALGPGWRLCVVAHDPRLARGTAVPLRSVFTTRHGGLVVNALASAPRPSD